MSFKITLKINGLLPFKHCFYILFYFICVGALTASMYMHWVHAVPRLVKKPFDLLEL